MATKEKDTEQKIKEAARNIFQEKGFAATKTRDIAEAADINLALLNYYFRSKKKLFDLIMVETMQSFFSGIIKILNNEKTSIKEKIQDFVDNYIDFLSENPNVAHFIINTVRESPDEYVQKIGLLDLAKDSAFFKSFQDAVLKKEIPAINPLHLLLNLMALVVFPFIVQPMFTAVSGLPKEAYFEMMTERKRLIPLWIESMLSVE
jgi:AcrR family transcriptional regulator